MTTAGNITGNDFIINGNLTVTGSQTIVSKDTISVADPMMVLGAGATSGSSDAGLLIDRGSDTNVAFIWDESKDQFAVVNTTATDNSTENITISSYSDLRVNNLVIGTETLTSSVVSNLNSMVGATPGTLTLGKAIVVDDNSHISAIKTSELHIGATGQATQVNSTADELNLLYGSSAKTIVNSKAVIYGSSGEVNVTKLQISGTDVTADATELNKLDGVTVGATDINKLANIDADIQTQVDAKLTITTASTTYAGINGSSTFTTVGDLTNGSIAEGFGDIDIGDNSVTAANATIGSILVGASNIGISGDTTLLTLSAGNLSVNGIVGMTGLKINNSTVDTTAAELNVLHNSGITTSNLELLGDITAPAAKLNHTSNVTSDIQTQLNAKITETVANTRYSVKAGSASITTVGNLSAGKLVGSFEGVDITTAIKTTGKVTAGTLDAGNVKVSGSTIGIAGDTNLITLNTGVLGVDGQLSATTLKLGGTAITANATNINNIAGVNYIS